MIKALTYLAERIKIRYVRIDFINGLGVCRPIHGDVPGESTRCANRIGIEHNLPALGTRDVSRADLRLDDVDEIVGPLPLHRDQTVQHPQVVVLKTVEREVLLRGRHPAEPGQVDVVANWPAFNALLQTIGRGA